MARGEAIGSSRTIGKRAIEFQQHEANIEHGKASDHDEKGQSNKAATLPQESESSRGD